MPEVTLEMMEYGLTSYVREPAAHNPLGTFANDLMAVHLKREAEGMRVKLTTHVLADKLPPVCVSRTVPVSFMFPRSPFQHWKQKHADAWWLHWFVRRWPIGMEQHNQQVSLTVDLQRFRTYPEANVPISPDNDRFGQARFGYSLDERIERTP